MIFDCCCGGGLGGSGDGLGQFGCDVVWGSGGGAAWVAFFLGLGMLCVIRAGVGFGVCATNLLSTSLKKSR